MAQFRVERRGTAAAAEQIKSTSEESWGEMMHMHAHVCVRPCSDLNAWSEAGIIDFNTKRRTRSARARFQIDDTVQNVCRAQNSVQNVERHAKNLGRTHVPGTLKGTEGDDGPIGAKQED